MTMDKMEYLGKMENKNYIMEMHEMEIINHYGVIPQLKYMQTEMFEFVEAVLDAQHYLKREGILLSNNLIEHIEEEYADITMMLEQIKLYYELDDNNIRKIKEDKIDRQLKRIDEEKKR